MRLDYYVAHSANLTRSEAKKALRAGRICLNSEVVTDGGRIVAFLDKIALDGNALTLPRKRYYMLNKPEGTVCANIDRYSKTVMELLPASLAGLNPVGRLDKDVNGLLLLTDDGDCAHRLISPSYAIEKVYIAEVDGLLDEGDVNAFSSPMDLSDFVTLPARLEIKESSIAKVYLCEGKFHQVKRMFAAIGKPVLSLRRVAFGPIELDDSLAPGEFRELYEHETQALLQSVERKNNERKK